VFLLLIFLFHDLDLDLSLLFSYGLEILLFSSFHAYDTYMQVQVICMHPPLNQSHFHAISFP
jgi:hypothetical protein